MSTEYVNLDSTIQGLKDTDTVQERNKELILEFFDNIAAEGIGDSQQRKYIWCLETAIAKFAPDDFILDDTEEKDIRRLMANVHRSDYSASTKNHMLVAVKRFYKYLNGGTYPDKVQFIKTTSEKDSPVSREDLFTEAELTRLLNELRKLRDKAFFKTLYESGARPGELADCTIADVEFNDKGDFIHLQGEKGTPDRTNQLIEAGQYLRK